MKIFGLGYNADILCLQEVDNKIFQNFLSPILGCEGYNGLFYKKGKEVAEGLACFYRTERFRYVVSNNYFIFDIMWLIYIYTDSE